MVSGPHSAHVALLAWSVSLSVLAQGAVPATAPDAAVGATSAAAAPGATGPGIDWIDPATGHRVIRISSIPGSQSLYFHQWAFTAAGDKMLITVPTGLATIDLTTLGISPCQTQVISLGAAEGPILAPRTRLAYFTRGNDVYAAHVDTLGTFPVGRLPAGLGPASGLAVNSDETLLASTGNDPAAADIVATSPAAPRSPFTPGNPPSGRGEGGRSMVLFTLNPRDGAITRVHYSTSWLNHTQFSPADPAQILFCHEGNWHEVDRIWTMRLDPLGPRVARLVHMRTMEYEIAGHEFFSFDGKMIYYDLQTPRSGQFWLAGTELATGQEYRYPIKRSEWSVHYHQSPDGKLFCGDGGGPSSVANRTPLPEGRILNPPENGQWIYLFTPQDVPWEELKAGDKTVRVGKLNAQRLVDLSKHDYTLEPNGRFTPDGKWIIFRSNMYDRVSHVYAVEVARARP